MILQRLLDPAAQPETMLLQSNSCRTAIVARFGIMLLGIKLPGVKLSGIKITQQHR